MRAPESLVDKLTDMQREAVLYPMRPLVIFAGPGSGKTTVLTLRAAHLLTSRQVGAEGLALVTFTRAAAREMQERLHLYAAELKFPLKQVTVSTFHSLFLQILLRHYGHLPSILSPSMQSQIAKEIVQVAELNDFIARVGLCKNNLITPNRLQVVRNEHLHFKRCYQEYEKKKQAIGAWDYDDILLCCYELLANQAEVLQEWRDRLQYVLVDEFQDTNRAQYETLKLLTPAGNLTVVGDDDQSIYGFRGSSVDFLLRFQNDNRECKLIVLNRNFRSTQHIIRLSQTLIQMNSIRQAKEVSGANEKGQLPLLIRPADEHTEAEWIVDQIKQTLSGKTVGVLFRTHAQGEFVMEELVRRRAAFQIREPIELWFEKWQSQGIVLILKVATEKDPHQKRQGLMNLLRRFIWLQTERESLAKDLQAISRLSAEQAVQFILEQLLFKKDLQNYANRLNLAFDQLYEPCLRMLQTASRFDSAEGLLAHIEHLKQELRLAESRRHPIQLCTFHGAKGLEFDAVFIVGCVDSVVPHRRALQSRYKKRAQEEERRLFYVACTRAKTTLFLSAPRRLAGHAAQMSSFLSGMCGIQDLALESHLDDRK